MALKLTREPLYQLAYEAFTSLLMAGTLQPGQRVTEKMLSELLGISSTPIREAMRKLQHDGLLENEGNTFRIISLTPTDVNELYVCRLALETLAIEKAVSKVLDSDIEDLEAILDMSEDAAKHQDFLNLVRANTMFHDKILEIGSNRWLTSTVAFVRRPLLLARMQTTFDRQEIPRILEDHYAIILGVKKRDSKASVEALIKHMEADCERMKQGLLEVTIQELRSQKRMA